MGKFGLNTILFINLIQHIYNHQQTGFLSKLEAYDPHLLYKHSIVNKRLDGLKAYCIETIVFATS